MRAERDFTKVILSTIPSLALLYMAGKFLELLKQ